MSDKRILSAGQCALDHGNILRAITEHFRAVVVPVATGDALREKLRAEHFDLVLLNRAFDGNGESGLDLIRELKSDKELSHTPLMLVSNFEDAQEEAEQAGALAGFGKNDLGTPVMLERLNTVLGQ